MEHITVSSDFDQSKLHIKNLIHYVYSLSALQVSDQKRSAKTTKSQLNNYLSSSKTATMFMHVLNRLALLCFQEQFNLHFKTFCEILVSK